MEQIAFSLLATSTGGAAVFAWHVKSDISSSILVNSLLTIPETDIPAALVRFVFSEFENTFFSPLWWDALDNSIQKILIERINHNTYVSGINSLFLREDHVRPVNWQITRIDQKRQ